MKSQLHLVLAAVLCLAACGTPGAPRPPSLRLPETVNDLAATRQGSTVTLAWTEPARTTDGENIRARGRTIVCMGVNDFPMTHCNQVVADLSQPAFAQCAPKLGQPVTCAVTLPFELQRNNPKGLATYAVVVANANGRTAGLSNQVRVPTAYTAEPIPNLHAEVTADAVRLKFTGFGLPKYDYHVLRAEAETGQYVDIGSAQQAEPQIQMARVAYVFSDHSFEWEKKYLYRVAAITTVSLPDGSIVDVRGDPTPDVSVVTHDVFAPVPPQSAQAVASGVGQPPFIDLTWAPNMESDLAGYNIYRHEEGQSAVKINAKLVKAPSYRDSNVERGHKYFYAVTAVDLRANESAKSGETSETVQ